MGASLHLCLFFCTFTVRIVFMDMVQIFLIILYILGLAMLAIETVDSELSKGIKNFFGLTSNNGKLVAMCSWKFYWKLFMLVSPKPLGVILFLIFSPISTISFILSNIAHFFVKLFECPFCLSFWYGTIFFYFQQSNDILTAILMGGVTLLITKMIDKHLLY